MEGPTVGHRHHRAVSTVVEGVLVVLVVMVVVKVDPVGGEKPEVACVKQVVVTTRSYDWIIPMLRLLAFFVTLVATLAMALNKQQKTFVVAPPTQVTLKPNFNTH